jgi:hypothetical protein
MQAKLTRRVSYVYLTLIPFLAAVPAFAIGHISYTIYLPIWIFSSALMLIAAWVLGAHVFRTAGVERKHFAVIAMLLILPWLFMSIFFGMGPPPDVPSTWIERSTEQQTRYTFLMISGISIAMGFAGLRVKLKNAGEDFYSMFGFVAIIMAIPLYLLYMTQLHTFDFESFKLSVASASGKMPEWYSPTNKQFLIVTVIDAALIYFATAVFASSLKTVGWFKKRASHIYTAISLFALLMVVFYPLYAKAVAFIGVFPLLIPAIPFIMPYLIGVNLLKLTGDKQFLLDTSQQ